MIMKVNSVFKSVGAFSLALTLSLVSCTDRVGDNEFNIINNGSTSTQVTDAQTAVGLLREAMGLVHDARVHKYQYQFNLHIDNYAGYLLVANKLQGRLPRIYSPNADFETGPKANMLWVAQQVVPVMNSAEELKRPELGAIASILFNFVASEYVDVHGPMPYKAYRVLQSEPPIVYEKVSEVYDLILKDLARQQQILKDLGNLPEAHRTELKQLDRIAGGDLHNWIKFANSLRMRMAMRMVKADPDKAKAEFEAAVADGYLDDADQDIELVDGGRHPLYTISEDWDDTRLNANFENLLRRLHHPGLAKWFEPLTTDNGTFVSNKKQSMKIAEGTFAGMRSGINTYAKEETIFSDSYKKFSRINSSYASRPIAIFKRSEVQFLLAEAALRKWNVPGAARTFYSKGIQMSFTKEGFGSSTDYRNQTANACPQVAYVDYWNAENNLPAEENGSKDLGVKWDEALGQEKLLEMIITQKYIANYPLSLESWSEYRRTGYPVMLAIHPDETGDGSIPPRGWTAPDGQQQPERSVRRIPFVKTGSVNISDVNESAIPALKAEDKSMFSGRDLQATHLWWDVAGKGNF